MKTLNILIYGLFSFTVYAEQSSLKILFIVKSFPRETQQYMNNQITGFIDQNVDVRILARTLSPQIYPIVLQYKLLERTYLKELPAHERKYDVLYCLFSSKAGRFIDYMHANNIEGKLVVCFRGGDANQKIAYRPEYYKKIFEHADIILVVCNAFKDSLIKHGCPENKILVHHSGINLDKFTYKERVMPLDGQIKILTVGRLIPMKGHEYALQAIYHLKKRYPNIKYEILGSGKLFENLQNIIKELNLDDCVTLRGYLPHDQVIEAMHNSHIFLLASHTIAKDQEGIPNAIMEAFATGMPVVATKHSGISELVQDGISGYLVPECDPVAMADKLEHLIKNPQLWKDMGKIGAEKVYIEHNKECLNERLLKIFRRLKQK